MTARKTNRAPPCMPSALALMVLALLGMRLALRRRA